MTHHEIRAAATPGPIARPSPRSTTSRILFTGATMTQQPTRGARDVDTSVPSFSVRCGRPGRWPSARGAHEDGTALSGSVAVQRDGRTVTEVAAAVGVSRQTVHSWLRRYEDG